MNFAGVEDDRHPGIVQGKNLGLLLADQGVVADVRLSGQLDYVEGEVPWRHERAMGDHRIHDMTVEHDAVRSANDGLSLIPDGAANG